MYLCIHKLKPYEMSYEIDQAQEEIKRVDSLEIPETKVCSTCEGTRVVQESLYAPLEACPDCKTKNTK